jgi:hypothetical protein
MATNSRPSRFCKFVCAPLAFRADAYTSGTVTNLDDTSNAKISLRYGPGSRTRRHSHEGGHYEEPGLVHRHRAAPGHGGVTDAEFKAKPRR